MEVDYQHKIQEVCEWIKKTVAESGFENVVVAVSGGIDSAVSLALCVRALGKDHVFALRLPYGKMSSQATADAKLVTAQLGFTKDHIFQIDIYKVVNKIEKIVILNESEGAQFIKKDSSPNPQNDKGENLDIIRKGNIMARVRMIVLYDFAKAKNCLVVGTENKSEYYLGYFTRFGDEASDVEPIRSFYKTQIREMAKVLDLPQEIITKPPTAGLWKGQTDEKEFGFTYDEADQVLYHHFDEGLPKEGLVDLGLSEELVNKVLQRVEANDFKHHLPRVF